MAPRYPSGIVDVVIMGQVHAGIAYEDFALPLHNIFFSQKPHSKAQDAI
jgi:hypothetical protein